jgi:protein-tyrosine-phosphatase
MPIPTSIVFVCLHGAAKSVIAATHCQRMAEEYGRTVRVTACGVEPDATIPAPVIAGLRGDGFDMSPGPPAPLNAASLDGAELIVSIGCDISNVADVAASGAAVVRWDGVPQVSDGYDAARDIIVAHLERLLNDLR